MAEDDHVIFSAGSDLDVRTHTTQPRPSASLSAEDAQQGATRPASAAEVAAAQQCAVDLRPRKSSDQASSVPRLRRDAGSSRNMQKATTPSPQSQETRKASASTSASPWPGPLVQETAKERAAGLIGGVATRSRQSSEFDVVADAGNSKEISAAAVAHLVAKNEDDSYRDEHEHSEGSDESANQGFEYGGEQGEQEEGGVEKQEKITQRKEGGQEAGENAAQERKQDGADETEKTTSRVPCDNSSPQGIAQDTLAKSSAPAGREEEVLTESPRNENIQHVSAVVAVSPQRRCSEAKEDGEKHEGAQAPHAALPAGSSTELTRNTRTADSATEPKSGTVPRTPVTDGLNGAIGARAAPGYYRRPSSMSVQPIRPARSAARASIQLSLPPLITEGVPETEFTCAVSNANAINMAHAAAEVEPEASGQPTESQSWAEYYALNDRRQHSTSNLVAVRRNLRRMSVELLFEDDDSDDSSTSSSSSGAVGGENASVQDGPNEIDDPMTWQQSEEGRSRMAQLTKATVAVESTVTKMSRKYLQLFAPSNSAHDTYKVLATMHRRNNGTGWPKRGGWDSYLVRRSRAELDDGRVYGVRSKEGRVELLLMSSNNVCGRIHPTIARLESLKCISLSDNNLSGPIPVELGLLLQLHTLQLHENNLRDTIPPVLGSLISLVRLSLGHNKLSGPLPDSLGNLVHLKYFSAEHNRLAGPIPNFLCHMTGLETFNVSNNELCGGIPHKIGALARLRKLDFSNNQLSGDIPASLGNLLELNWLLLNHNQLTGPVPASLGNLKELLLINLSFNRLSGPLPAALPLLVKLTSACLQGNLFVGPFRLPKNVQYWFSRISGMAAIDFGSNEIEEPFPDMRGMNQLQTLLLDNNRMYGRLAIGLAEACPNLYKLHLQNNRLSGEIPHNLGALTKLEVLDLSNNRFDGSLPPSMKSLHLLNTFSASNNELSGELPPFLGSLTLLTCLALNGNQFSGPMPRELGKLTVLKRLYLENNELAGSIPKELSKCTSLEELYLHDNGLWGNIPDSLRSLRGLRYLYLYRNKLTGMVPEWLGELFRLRGLILGENRLRGHIPWQLGHLHKLQDLYLNDNNLNGSIPERMVANCECLQRLYLGGNRLTGTVPRYLWHVRDLREINIERNNLQGELPIPLFLKTSLGPKACGLKWEGNPRIVDSRHNFTRVLGGHRQRAGPETTTGPSSELQHHQQPRQARRESVSVFRPISFALVLSGRQRTSRSRASMSRGYEKMSTGLCCLEPVKSRAGDGLVMIDSEHEEGGNKDSEECGRGRGDGGGVGAMEEGGCCGAGDGDCGSVARPWANSEDVSYFLFKVVAGNASVLMDYVIAARLYTIGCVWGCVLVMLWKAIAGFEGVLATLRLGYGRCWLPMSALGLALAWQARICFYHSCESDLFQALQQVEWRWHAMIQLGTQLAAALSWWGRGQVGHWYLLASVGLKALVVGIVSMQRLDDKRLTQLCRERRSGSPRLGSAPSVLRDRFLPWLLDSAWPRLVLVGFHFAEVCERTIPLASLTAAFGDWAFLAPLALTPGMLARYVARRPRTSRPRGDRGGVASSVRSALKFSLALDSAFGAGTRGHVLATISTTLEAILFNTVASEAPREYPDSLFHGLSFSVFAMLVFTWAVVVLELVIPAVGREGGPRRGREPPRLLLLPPRSQPPPRWLLLLRRFAPCKPFFLRPWSGAGAGARAGSRPAPTTIHVQPSVSSLRVPPDDDSSGSSMEDGGCRQPGGRGGKGAALVVPMEG